MEKKIAELEMGRLHLQQNIDIPEIFQNYSTQKYFLKYKYESIL